MDANETLFKRWRLVLDVSLQLSEAREAAERIEDNILSLWTQNSVIDILSYKDANFRQTLANMKFKFMPGCFRL